jgi:hypothetical protein
MRKAEVLDFLVGNMEILVNWLSCARSTDSELKKAFLVSLKQLVKPPKTLEDREKVRELVRRLFSNFTSPSKLPDLGNEQQAIEYLIKVTDVPFEDMEKTGLAVIKQLINWEWGMRALYGNSQAISYILNRGDRAKEILEVKYRIVQKTLQS